MAYSILTQDGQPKPIRIMNEGCACGKPFTAEWVCDPCAAPYRRYRIKHPGGQWIEHPWHTIIAPDDSARVRYIKREHGRKIAEARHAVAAAQANLRRLTA